MPAVKGMWMKLPRQQELPTLPKKALTPETVSKSHGLMRKRTKPETAHPPIVMPKPVIINSPPRNAQMLKN